MARGGIVPWQQPGSRASPESTRGFYVPVAKQANVPTSKVGSPKGLRVRFPPGAPRPDLAVSTGAIAKLQSLPKVLPKDFAEVQPEYAAKKLLAIHRAHRTGNNKAHDGFCTIFSVAGSCQGYHLRPGLSDAPEGLAPVRFYFC